MWFGGVFLDFDVLGEEFLIECPGGLGVLYIWEGVFEGLDLVSEGLLLHLLLFYLLEVEFLEVLVVVEDGLELGVYLVRI